MPRPAQFFFQSACLVACALSDKKPDDTASHDTASPDVDGDGWSRADGDCDDADPLTHPPLAALVTPILDRSGLGTSFDASAFDYLVLPFMGAANQDPVDLHLKLEDADGCRTRVEYEHMADLPVRRGILVSLDLFATGTPESDACVTGPDMSRLVAVEIGVRDADADAGRAVQGTCRFGSPTLLVSDDLRVSTRHFSCRPIDDALRARIASALADQQQECGLLPTWEGESTFNVYSQAMALMVFSLEYARTGEASVARSAEAVATALIGVQDIDGGWGTLFSWDGSGFIASAPEPWVGNVAWVIRSLVVYRDEVAVPLSLDDPGLAIEAGADWIVGEMNTSYGTGPYRGVNSGVEGNVSAALALLDVGRPEAAEINAFLLDNAYDEAEGRFRMGVTDAGLAIDVVGNWGADLHRAFGETDRALSGLGLGLGTFWVTASSPAPPRTSTEDPGGRRPWSG